MKRIKRGICVCLAALFLCGAASLVGCKEEKTAEPTYRVGIHNYSATKTGKAFIQNGSSYYKIAIPENATDYDKTAAAELQYFLQLSTGYQMEVVSEGEAGEKFVSLGQTSLLKDAGVEVDSKLLGRSGYRIVTKGDDVYIFGADNLEGMGTVFGVYEFLRKSINYEYYSSLEVQYDKTSTVELLNFDTTDVADYETRSVSNLTLTEDNIHALRMGYTPSTNYTVPLDAHSHLDVLPVEAYGEEHPEWFNAKKTQVCMTNEGALKEFVYQVTQLFDKYPKASFIFLGQEDNNDRCECAGCLEGVRKYGTYGGLNLVFINKVAEACDAWLAERYPSRQMIYATFAYFETEEPPVVYDEATDTYSPVCDEVIARDNVRVRVASIGMPYGYSIRDDINVSFRETYRGWGAVCDNLSVHTYMLNYACYFFGFDNYNSLKDYEFYFQNGANEMKANGAIRCDVPCFMELKDFLQSRLMWDTSLNMDELVDEFMENYFKDAGSLMREYYDLYRDHMMKLRATYELTGTCSEQLWIAEYWPKNFLDKLQGLVDEGLKLVEEKYAEGDPALYENLSYKLKKESLMQTAMYQEWYGQYFTKEQNKIMLDEFSEICISARIYYFRENAASQMADIIAEWRVQNT